jgi:hypothetical protein
MTRTAWHWTLAAAMAAALCAGALLDADPDMSGELTAAQRQAVAERRQEQAAAQFCMRAHGPGAAHRWDSQGRLVCTTHRSPKPLMVVEK